MRSTSLHIALLAISLLSAACHRHRPLEDDVESLSDSVATIEQATNDAKYVDLEIPFIVRDSLNQILRRERYTVSYNRETLNPNWVAWVLTRESAQGEVEKKIWFDDKGNAQGIVNFKPDMVKGTYIVDAESETPSPQFEDWDKMPDGMSHGHMCPAGDCKTSPVAVTQSFLLTNMCVQARNLNSGSWNRLEMKCRDLAKKYGRIYIVAGPIFKDGKVSVKMGNIAIPDAFFKVLLCMDGSPKAIGFVYSNTNDKHNMDESACTVDDVELLTGIDFFPQLPDSIEHEVESKANLNEWQ